MAYSEKDLYKKLARLHKKKANCLQYSSTPNQCDTYYAKLIKNYETKIRLNRMKKNIGKQYQESSVELYLNYLAEAGFETKPRGWTDKSVKKTGATLAKHMGLKSAKDKGFFDKCVKKMRKHMKNPEGYCASLKDEAYDSTYWRGKGKTKKQALKRTRLHKNV